MLKVFLISLSILLSFPNFLDVNISEPDRYNKKEKYSASLSTIRNLDDMERYADNLAIQRNIAIPSLDYCILLESIISQRFYHGFSRYSFKENWIAGITEKITGSGTSCIVQPDDILKHQNAACSQQAIIMMNLLKRKKISYRKIGFPHHFALEASVDGKWYFFDPNMEPTFAAAYRDHEFWSGSNDKLKPYYDSTINPLLNYRLGTKETAEIGAVNYNPAPRLKIFQYVTNFLSKILWLIPLLILYFKWNRVTEYREVYMEQRDLRPLFS